MSDHPNPSHDGARRIRGARVGRRLLPIAVIALAAASIYSLDLHDYLSFEALREHRATLLGFVSRDAVLSALIYIAVYAASTALSLPGGTVLSIAGGFLFGGLLGGVWVVLGATAGSTLLFLAARTVLGDSLRRRAGPWLTKLQVGFQENAFSYLLVLRLVPLFPFFVVNLVPAFLGVSTRIYLIATVVGIIPGALVFTFAGAGLGVVLDSGESLTPGVILTPEIVVALTGLAVLALIPVVYKRFNENARRKVEST
jgi:uncharacterized membrane protein YdjX (TVP38/TMEM64 family)